MKKIKKQVKIGKFSYYCYCRQLYMESYIYH